MSDSFQTLNFECPRCKKNTDARFFGPCPNCINELQSAYPAASRSVEKEEYEPKMNVTPNAVASKE